MKLEFKHLAPYLPYEVKVIDTEAEDCIWTLHPYKDSLDCLNDNEHISLENFITENNATKTPVHKLLLRPLSDLTKKIEHNGEKFVPAKEIKRKFKKILFCGFGNPKTIWIENGYIRCYDFSASILIFQQLLEWHFDVFGLIDQGLALPLM